MPRTIILASGSPRRKELLTLMGVPFEIIVSNFDEQLDDSRSTETVAIELALGKARSVAAQHPEAIIIGSDTIPTLRGKQLEKARDEADARRILTALTGTYNDVTTSIVVVCKATNTELTDAVTARVHFKPLNLAAIETYLATGDYKDKAAAYAVQGEGRVLIDRIEGDYSTVIGLPTTALSKLLKQVGIDSQPVVLNCPVPNTI